ncbi:hypothetical protein OIU77_019562 [Salix suchowensis]|uniref:VQ domain-containing protein n=1 Tax=Salix suchowensis TaxID=1278906 RepID=A0ABQ9CJV4_9ROSI|nr:VQ motif-containing family protein [Salix suchowensis]KAJ6398817.1 hypothetical protein OIU77_019562 [Salix suchowensis]
MDSGNSGSMQSSSGGGDEEYDSRQESLPAFLNASSQNFDSSLFSHQQPATMFDPSPALFHAFSQSQPITNPDSSMLNLDMVHSRGLRSDHSCTQLGINLPDSLSSSQSALLGAQGSSHQALPSSMQLRSVHDCGVRSSSPSDQTHEVARNPKKRTRASRRAPTTVLTTDTSNFRQMVQEFTGIPAPPFTGSPFTRRLDLFGPGSGSRSGHLEPVGSSLYRLRPSAQRVHHDQQTPFLSSSSPSFFNNDTVDGTNIASTSTTANSNNTNTTATTSTFNPGSVNYQLSAHLGLHKQSQDLLNMQNQILSIQPLLQPPAPPFQPLANVPGLGAKSQAGFPFPSLEELGMGHGGRGGDGDGDVNAHLGGLSGHVTAEGMKLSNDGSQDHNLRSLDGNYGNMKRVNSCKLNYSSASSSGFHHDKVLENVSSRGAEGTVDSWICPPEFRVGDH